MKSKNFKEYLKELKEEAKNYNETKDNQSYIYIYQLTDLFYSELSTIVLDQKVLNDSIYNNFRKNILEVFDKLKDYINKTRNVKEKDINELLKLCLSNDYFDQKNLEPKQRSYFDKISNYIDFKNRFFQMNSSEVT